MDKYQMREVIAKRAAKELHDGDVVNLGIGIPTLIPNYLPEGVSVTLQTENGAMGMGPTPEEGKEERFAKERAAGIPMLTGRDLSLGLRDFALEEYGPMAFFTLGRWNLHSTSDFGEIVFNLIKMGRFSQNHGDKKSDFDNVFDFREAFCKPYED